jgi:large subunit ribosomal protein L24
MQRLRVGDLVVVIAGRDKGKTGKVQRIFHEDQRVLVEGINMVTRHKKPTQQNQSGGRSKGEAPLHISNVMPIDSESGKPTRVKVVTDDEGSKKRVSRSGAEIKTG